MMDDIVKIRVYGMTPANAFLNVGCILNIFRIKDEIVWCYCQPETFGEHPGCVKLLSSGLIKIFPKGLCSNGGNVRSSSIHELKCSPKLTHNSLICFSFSNEPVEFESAERARLKFFIELGVIHKDQHAILNSMIPLGTDVEENVRLNSLLEYKHPKCPKCNNILEKVISSGSLLNSEQFDSCRAGDFYCDKCPSNGRGNTNFCYWWDKELDRGPFSKYFEGQ